MSAITFNANGPTGNQKTTASTLGITGTAVSAGTFLIVLAAAIGSGALGFTSITDSQGNSYQAIIENHSFSGHSSVMGIGYIEKALATTDTVTITWQSNSTARAAVSWAFDSLSNFVPDATTGTLTGSSGSPSLSVTSVTTETLFIGTVEVNATTGDGFTGDSDTTNGSWSTVASSGTGGGGAASNVSCYGQYKITTAHGGQTWNPTLGNTNRNFTSELAAIRGAGFTQPTNFQDPGIL